MNLSKLINAFHTKKIGKTDMGILKVAFMVAALDGEVTKAEYEAFDAMAKKCKGYTPKSAAKALDEATRSAGYLMLLGQRVSDAELVKAFVNEAQVVLPGGFAYMTIEAVRDAVILWTAMAISDGDYSNREKKCIEALRRLFAEMKVQHIEQEEEHALAIMPAFAQAYNPGSRDRVVQLISKDFVSRVEDVIKQYGDSADASKILKELIAKGE